MAVLLDTSYLLRFIGIHVEGLDLERVGALLAEERIQICEVQLHELLLVGLKHHRRGAIEADRIVRGIDLARRFETIPLTGGVASRTMRVGRILRDPFDSVILGTALTVSTMLVTLDRAMIRAARHPDVKALNPALKILTL